MTTSSSSVPVLGPVLYFTSTDGYSFDVDNRPLLHLDTNIRHINTSLVGIGYGEHAPLSGGILASGRIVTLFPNGSIYYPTSAPSTNPSENIVGLVIGATDSGLNRVLWASKHLDLDVLGLSAYVSTAPAGSYITTSGGSSGIILNKTTPLATDYVLGRVKSGPYIEINTSSELLANDATIGVSNAALDNHANLYGFTRLKNLLLYIDAGQTPMQYTKRTLRQSDYSISQNPMNVQLTDSGILQAGSTDSLASGGYGTVLNNSILKESYIQYTNLTTGDVVQCGSSSSGWATTAFNTELPFVAGSQNHELQRITMQGTVSGIDYTTAPNLELFKQFRIDKFYQYARTVDAPAAGKVQATATVFSPLPGTTVGYGGELTRTIVWDFYTYNISGFETLKQRVVTTGEASEQALLSTGPDGGGGIPIFPSTLITA